MSASHRTRRAGPTIVVGYDGSPASRAAVSWAAQRAGRSGRLILVNAGRRHGGLLDRPSFEVWVRDRHAFGHALIDELFLERDDLARDGIDVEVVDDLPARVLLGAAPKHDADEIVIGTRHRGRFAALHGSVARELLNDATARSCSCRRTAWSTPCPSRASPTPEAENHNPCPTP